MSPCQCGGFVEAVLTDSRTWKALHLLPRFATDEISRPSAWYNSSSASSFHDERRDEDGAAPG